MDHPNEWKTSFTTRCGKKLVFRPEHADDTELLLQMFSTLSKESASNLLPPFTRERVENWTKNIDYNEVLAIVAVIQEDKEQRIIGSASLKFNAQKALRHKAELSITVHDDYQKMGIGTALVNHLIVIARKKGLTKIYLNVSTTNDQAIHIYKKTGFIIEGRLNRESFINGKYRDEYRMALLL